jgi:hypothetical protein
MSELTDRGRLSRRNSSISSDFRSCGDGVGQCIRLWGRRRETEDVKELMASAEPHAERGHGAEIITHLQSVEKLARTVSTHHRHGPIAFLMNSIGNTDIVLLFLYFSDMDGQKWNFSGAVDQKALKGRDFGPTLVPWPPRHPRRPAGGRRPPTVGQLPPQFRCPTDR